MTCIKCKRKLTKPAGTTNQIINQYCCHRCGATYKRNQSKV